MRSVVLIAGVITAIVSTAATADAQFRGRLDSRAAAPSVDPRPASPTLQSLPIWWHSGIVALPEAIALAQPGDRQGGADRRRPARYPAVERAGLR